jgi:hypothetical protein
MRTYRAKCIDDVPILVCIAITPDARTKVTIDPTMYSIQGVKDGLCFLLTLILKAQIDTMGMVDRLRSSPGDLLTKKVELSGNIIDFRA